MYYSQRKELEDSQQSSHKEQVDALWSRLEAASEAHKQQVQQLQEKQQELVMQLEQRDTDRSQVSELLLQVSQEQQQQAYNAHTSCSCEGEEVKDAGAMSNKIWWYMYRACRSCWLQDLLNRGATYTC